MTTMKEYCGHGALCGGLVAAALCAMPAADASAQGWPVWADRVFGNDSAISRSRPRQREPRPQNDWGGWSGWSEAPDQYRADQYRADRNRDTDQWDPPPQRRYPELLTGGPRPDIQPVAPPVVNFTAAGYETNSIVIDSAARKLYYVLPGNRAYAYQISVGREGFAWTGTEKVSRKQDWPDWHPPAEMRAREPGLPKRMTGGVRNPLGAKALYLGNTLYRIHGTNDAKTIGRAASSGCFRMMNSAVLHLASITPVGTTVRVVKQLPASAVATAGPLMQQSRASLGRGVSP